MPRGGFLSDKNSPEHVRGVAEPLEPPRSLVLNYKALTQLPSPLTGEGPGVRAPKSWQVEYVMYAIIQDGARQFQVEPGQQLDIDYRDLPVGDEVKFDRVLAYRDDDGLKIGRPTLESATVTAKVVSVVQGPKLVVQKFRRRKNSAVGPATGRFIPGWSSTRFSSARNRWVPSGMGASQGPRTGSPRLDSCSLASQARTNLAEAA